MGGKITYQELRNNARQMETPKQNMEGLGKGENHRQLQLQTRQRMMKKIASFIKSPYTFRMKIDTGPTDIIGLAGRINSRHIGAAIC